MAGTIATITTEDFDAYIGAYRELALFGVASDAPSETISVTYQVMDDPADLAVDSDVDVDDDGDDAP